MIRNAVESTQVGGIFGFE